MPTISPLAEWRAVQSLMDQALHYGQDVDKNNPPQHINFIIHEKKKDIVGDAPPEILKSVRDHFDPVLDFIKVFLLQDSGSAFYAMIMLDFDCDIDFIQNGFISTDLNVRPMLITLNPFCARNYTLNELIGEVLQEVVRLIYMHPISFAKNNPECDPGKHESLEIGSSVSSSETVFSDIHLQGNSNRIKLNNSVFTKSDLEQQILNSRSAQCNQSMDYYFTLAESKRKQKQTPPDIQNASGGHQCHNWESIKNPQTTQDELAASIKNSYDRLTAEQRGTLPSSIKDQIEKLCQPPKISWKDAFRNLIGTIPAEHRPSRLRLNRRQPDRFDLAGQLSNKHVRIVIGIDTSGSMSDTAIAYCLNEIDHMVSSYETEITVIECDCEIGKVYTVKRAKDINYNVTGRGGTSFTPVIDYINAHKFKDAIMIYFTDGYGESSIPQPKTRKNMWVIVGGDENDLSVREPYGRVFSLNDDEDYKKLH